MVMKERKVMTLDEISNLSIEKIDDLELLELIINSSLKLMVIHKSEIDMVRNIIEFGIEATNRYLDFIVDEEKELVLAEFYLIKGTLNKNNIDIELLEKSKNIFSKQYERTKDEKVLLRIQKLIEEFNLVKEK